MKTPYRFLLAGLIAVPVLLAQNPTPAPTGGGGTNATPAPAPAPAVDPFARQPERELTPEEIEDNRPKQVSVCVECFSVDLADAAALQRANMKDPALYKELVDRVAKGKAVQEHFIIARARSGEKAIVESISEMIYPTGYEHGSGPKPVQPQKLGASATNAAPAGGAQPLTPADPNQAAEPRPATAYPPPLGTSYETRNTGATLEIEPTIGGDNEVIDLRLAPDLVTYAGRSKWSKESSETEMPTFESQRTTTALTLRAGQPCLLGTLSRPPVSAFDPNSAKRVWFSFVTGTINKPFSN